VKRIALVRTVLAIALGALSVAPAYSQLGRQQGLLEPNVATEQELMALPHMNATLVKGILERRPFLSIKDLDAHLAGSLSAEQRKELYGRMFVHISLNTATSEEIMLIPGMGRRMVHEFEEYRPYKSLAQFRKEIGKYVDEKEVARLEQYVFVPLNLNTAADEELQSIPGLGRRMLREFKEYRPYANIEQFRKEIGKYVNAKEVARLERYVTLQ
jgi:DNA uptake protein ComE-like DNA-binding protein